jgi:phosphoesterase RecJ-like protein
VDETFDAAVIMECGDLSRTGVTGLDRSPVLNIDHHPGNTRYGAVNWVDESAAACGELVYPLVTALGAPVSADVATHIYLAILTDTGSFHFSHMSPRTFEIAARCVEAGAQPAWIARTHYDSNRITRVRLFGSAWAWSWMPPARSRCSPSRRRWRPPPMAATTTPKAHQLPASVKAVRRWRFQAGRDA